MPDDPKKEVRQMRQPMEYMALDDGKVGSIYGFPIVYDKESEYMGFIETIAPGAAKKALKRSDIRGLKNHDPSLIFGRQGVNIKFEDTEKGLRYEAAPIDTRNFQETAEEVKLGLLTGQSFGFTVKRDKWEDLDTDTPKRTITEIDQIFDVGPVTYPAYPDTSVALRSLEVAKEPPVETPSFTLVTVNINGQVLDINDTEAIDALIEDIRSGSSPTTPDPDSADDDQTIARSSDVDDETRDVFNEFDTIKKRMGFGG